jgi:hypothetical protein
VGKKPKSTIARRRPGHSGCFVDQESEPERSDGIAFDSTIGEAGIFLDPAFAAKRPKKRMKGIDIQAKWHLSFGDFFHISRVLSVFR